MKRKLKKQLALDLKYLKDNLEFDYEYIKDLIIELNIIKKESA